jgi:hypothetical protein
VVSAQRLSIVPNRQGLDQRAASASKAPCWGHAIIGHLWDAARHDGPIMVPRELRTIARALESAAAPVRKRLASDDELSGICRDIVRVCRKTLPARISCEVGFAATSADRPSSFAWRLQRLSTDFGLQHRPVGGSSLLGAARPIAGPPGSPGFHRSGAGPIFASQGDLVLDSAVENRGPGACIVRSSRCENCHLHRALTPHLPRVMRQGF